MPSRQSDCGGRLSNHTRRTLVALTLCWSVLLTSGCSAVAPSTDPPSEPSAGATAAPTPTVTPPPSDPVVLVPGGSAEENRTFFDTVNREVLAADPEAGGRAFVDALVAAGFPKGDMEVTEDTTAIGGDADSVQFSVRLGASCLIGQRGSSGYASVVAPALGTGRCLVGETRDIDW